MKSLYTYIPHDEGINVCISALQPFYGSDLPLSVKHLRQILHFILQSNYFQFLDKFCLQTHGTDMGSPFAPNFANILMDSIERYIRNSAPGGGGYEATRMVSFHRRHFWYLDSQC